MNFDLVLVLLFLFWQVSHETDEEDSFYLIVKEWKGDLILTDCERGDGADSDACLRRGEKDLNCMCEDSYKDAERKRADCGDNGIDEAAVDMLEERIEAEFRKSGLTLGICARAFAKLGYNIRVNRSQNSTASNDTCYTGDKLAATISDLTRYAADFWKLLDRTLVGVYLSSDRQRFICKDAYNEWLCSTILSLYTEDGDEMKPCLDVCTRVVQECPYYLPSKFQDQSDDEIIYGGYPVFDCPNEKILKFYETKASCRIPYSLRGKCIHRGGTSLTQSSLALLLLSIALSRIL